MINYIYITIGGFYVGSSAILDALDGRIARLIKGTSEFG